MMRALRCMLWWTVGLTSASAWAQAHEAIETAGHSTSVVMVTEPSPQERIAQGRLLQNRRADLERTYNDALAQCYQQFDVTRCRNEVREKRIQANAVLRQEELAHNARERQIAAREAEQRSQEKQRAAQQREAELAANPATPSASDTTADAAKPARPDAQKRMAYEQKQREAEERKNSLEKRLRERNKSPAAPLPLPEGAR